MVYAKCNEAPWNVYGNMCGASSIFSRGSGLFAYVIDASHVIHCEWFTFLGRKTPTSAAQAIGDDEEILSEKGTHQDSPSEGRSVHLLDEGWQWSSSHLFSV